MATFMDWLKYKAPFDKKMVGLDWGPGDRLKPIGPNAEQAREMVASGGSPPTTIDAAQQWEDQQAKAPVLEGRHPWPLNFMKTSDYPLPDSVPSSVGGALGFEGSGAPVGTTAPDVAAAPSSTPDFSAMANQYQDITYPQIRSMVRRLGPSGGSPELTQAVEAYNARQQQRGGPMMTPGVMKTINDRYLGNTATQQTVKAPTVRGLNMMQGGRNRNQLLSLINNPSMFYRMYRPDVSTLDMNAEVKQRLNEIIASMNKG